MELVVNTEYQDVYRVDDGVLLVVNKFIENDDYGLHCYLTSAKDKPYHKGTQGLRILKEDTENKEYNYETGKYEKVCVVPKGTVLRYSFPIKTTDKSEWWYEIKTTGNSFSGLREDMLNYLEEIKKKIME